MDIWGDVLKLLVGFALTTVVGGILTFWFQRLAWRRQARLELFRQRYADGLKFVSELMKLIDRRLFRLQQVVWALEENGPEDRMKAALASYFEAVQDWNETLRSTHTYLQLLVGQGCAASFLDFADDDRPVPQSLHYKFMRAHRSMLKARSDKSAVAEASDALGKLNVDASDFCLSLATRFEKSASELFNLKRTSVDKSNSKLELPGE